MLKLKFLIVCAIFGIFDCRELSKMGGNVNKFSLKIFKHLAEKNVENVVFSPLSINMVLKMASLGATNETAKEMFDILFHVSENHDRLRYAKHSQELIKEILKDETVKMANKIFLSEEYTLKPKFKDIVQNQFLSEIETVNFGDQAVTTKGINNWVSEKTEGKIAEIIDEEGLAEDTAMILLNAVYFKGNWEIQFDPEVTRNRTFHNYGLVGNKIPMMTNNEESFGYGYADELDAKLLELKYKDSEMSLVIILPNKKNGLQEMVTKMADMKLNDILSKIRKGRIMVSMPKFKIEYEKDVTSILKNMGMKRMFSAAAEFGEMFEDDRKVEVSDVIHKAVIEVNELGTEGMLLLQKRLFCLKTNFI